MTFRLAFAVACLFVPVSGCSTMTAQRAALVTKIQNDVSDIPGFAASSSLNRTLEAIGVVRREDFVPPTIRKQAYAERPEPIGFNQTISDPYIVAIMTAAAEVKPSARVLEIGTGSGYQAAVLSRLARKVYSIEIVEPLATAASARLWHLGYHNVRVRVGDGSGGWDDEAPFDAIMVTAGAAEPPPRLLEQLAPGGRLVMPVGPTTVQERIIVYKKGLNNSITRCVLGSAMFVPLVGQGERAPKLMGVEEPGLAYCYGADIGRWAFEVASPSS